MTVYSDLIASIRDRLDDIAQPYLWSDTELAGYLNEAQREACVRAKLIRDRVTPAVVEISLTDSDVWYPLHQKIIQVDAAFYNGVRLYEMPEDGIEDTTTTGTPTYYVVDGQNIRVYPLNTVAADLTLVAFRLPLANIDAGHDPEIPEEHYYRLIDWAVRCAYLKRDSDAYDENRAATHESLFEKSFGKREDANVRRKHNELRLNTVAFNQF